MKSLYINYEHCTSLEQLNGYFTESLTPDSDTYLDLLDYGRHGNIAVFLRQIDEPAIALRVESIPKGISDSDFYKKLKEAITGKKSETTDDLKPSFDRCFRLDGVRCEATDDGMKVYIKLFVLMRVNETYELSITSNWGTRGESVNPYDYIEGKTEEIEIFSRKKPGKDIGKIVIRADDKELAIVSDISNDTFSSGQEKTCDTHSESDSTPVIVIPETIYDNDDYDDEKKLLGIRLTMVSNKGRVLYVHDTLVNSSDDYFIKNGALYICSVPGSKFYDVNSINVAWMKIDKKGKSSRIRAEQLPIKDSFNYSIRETIFEQSHPHCHVHELGTIDGKHIFSALPLTDNNGVINLVDYYRESSTIYDEDFNRIMSVRAGFEPVRLYKSWYLLVKECRTQRYGIIDKNQNIVIPCEYEYEINELSEGFFNVLAVGIDKTVYVAKEHKWYNCLDYDIHGDYLAKKNNAGIYQLINMKSGNVLIESEEKFGNGPIYPKGFTLFVVWSDNDGYYTEILCHDDCVIKLDEGEDVCSFKDSEEYISEGRIITLISEEGSDGKEIMFRIRDYSGRIIKELDPSYQFRRGYKYGKALFIKESSRCRRVGYVDLSGKVTLLPFEIPLKHAFDEDEWIEMIDVDCEFISCDSILINNDYDQYLIDVNGSILDDGDNYINVLADDLLMINRTYGSKNMGTLCNGHGEVLYRYEDTSAQLEVIQ